MAEANLPETSEEPRPRKTPVPGGAPWHLPLHPMEPQSQAQSSKYEEEQIPYVIGARP